MKLYWVKTNRAIKWIFSKYIWSIPNNDKKIYLTFDDGPTPKVTDWILDILKEYNIKATFFCIGKNIKNHPEILNRIITDGHSIGNHTQNHLDGWKNNFKTYIENFSECEKIISENYLEFKDTKLFRPPYGKIRRIESNYIRDKGYKIIMWDVLSADFDQTISPEKCLNNVVKNAKSGSIIIFHDSVKAYNNLKFALPKAIEYLKQNNYNFDRIT